jgi:hypothetical protein
VPDFELGELVGIRRLALYNIVGRAGQEVSERYLERRVTGDYISQEPSLKI